MAGVIRVIADETGKVRIETEGYKGDSCLEATKALEAALGKVEKETKTKEFKEKRIKVQSDNLVNQ